VREYRWTPTCLPPSPRVVRVILGLRSSLCEGRGEIRHRVARPVSAVGRGRTPQGDSRSTVIDPDARCHRCDVCLPELGLRARRGSAPNSLRRALLVPITSRSPGGTRRSSRRFGSSPSLERRLAAAGVFDFFASHRRVVPGTTKPNRRPPRRRDQPLVTARSTPSRRSRRCPRRSKESAGRRCPDRPRPRRSRRRSTCRWLPPPARD